MRKSGIVFVLLLCALSIYAASNDQAAENIVVKQYSFAEELVNLPIKEFVVGVINENDLLSADPQALKLYESAINAEKSPDVFKNPASAIGFWQDLERVARNNPFMKIAQKRLGEWKTLLALYEKHQGNLDKFKILFASSALPSTQKVSLAQKHFGDFGVIFGTKEIVNMLQGVAGKEEILSDAAFKAQIEDIKQKRCKLGVTSDCAEKPKPEPAAAYAAAPAAAAKTAKTYTLSEEPVGLVNPPAEVNGSDVMNADAEVLKLFETASSVDRQPESFSNPVNAVSAWENVAGAAGNNPFVPTAQQRISDWKGAIAKLDAHEADLAKLKTDISNTSLQSSQKSDAIVAYLDKHGVIFGTSDVVNLIVPPQGASTESNDLYQNYAYYVSEASYKELANNDSVKAKIKETRNKRCELKSGADCKNYAENHAADESEKAAYLKKACDCGVQDACAAQTAAATQPVKDSQKKQAEQPKSENDKYEEELNRAGKRARIIAASTTLAAGVVIGGLGGLSFWGMSKAKKNRDDYLDLYYGVTTPDDQEAMDYYRDNANKSEKQRKKFKVLGAVGVGVGAALIATGITLFCVEFEGEKEVKKKYNVSFGANPLDGSFQFAMNW